jgi:hypothetical protein
MMDSPTEPATKDVEKPVVQYSGIVRESGSWSEKPESEVEPKNEQAKCRKSTG